MGVTLEPEPACSLDHCHVDLSLRVPQSVFGASCARPLCELLAHEDATVRAHGTCAPASAPRQHCAPMPNAAVLTLLATRRHATCPCPHPAAKAFDQFTKSPEDRAQVIDALHIVPRLASILTDQQDSATKRSAGNALQALCSTYADAATRLRALARAAEGGDDLRRALMAAPALRAIALE